MNLTSETLVTVVLSAFSSGLGVYVAMRVELARVGMLAKLAADSAEMAHRRIDALRDK